MRSPVPRNVLVLLTMTLLAARASAREKLFTETLGPVKVGAVTQTAPLVIPYITWGGDVATFHANGGLTTKEGSIFHQLGLNIKLVAGDDFVQQTRDYMAGKSPFLRGTFHMAGLASEAIAHDPKTKGVVIVQMTWSAGDHMVGRKEIRTVADLRGKTIVLQYLGPHVGMLDDILKTAQLSWDDVKIEWAKDLTGSPQSPAEIFRNRPDVHACFVITPDMIGLTGGMSNIGSGAEGTVEGARVVVSTAELSRSIADMYVCRKDFYDAHPDVIRKFVSGYLKACEEIVDLKKQYETKGSAKYMEILQLTQDIYGAQIIPTLEEDAHGLLSDCTFVGYPGNVAFFTQKDSLHGFEAFQKGALELAVSRGYAKVKSGLLPSGLDYSSKDFTNYLTKITSEKGEKFRAEAVLEEIEQLSEGGNLDERTIVSFTINFEPNQEEFSSVQYGSEYQRLIEMADKYGNAVFAIRGHADPTKTLLDLVRAGSEKGVLQRAGAAGKYTYSFKGRPLDLSQTKEILRHVEEGHFDGASSGNPRQTMQAALNLSRSRAESVRDSVLEFAKQKGIHIDRSQIQPQGVGIREPFIAKPKDLNEAKQNMRVEFRMIRVTAEAATHSDFDF